MRGAKAAILSIVAAWVLVLSPAAAWAKGAKELKKGVAAYNDLEYERAVKLLETALKKKLDKKDQVEAYRYIALSYLALGKKDEAKAAYKKLIEADPAFELPDTESPVAIELFAEAKGRPPKPEEKPGEEKVDVELPPDEMERTESKVHQITIEPAFSPADPAPGQGVAVVMRLIPPDAPIESVVLKYRVQKQGKRSGWSQIKAENEGGGRWSGMIPGDFVKGPAIEYYAIAFDAAGGAKATVGSESQPGVLVVANEARDQAAGPPIYTRWWFWAAVGGVVVAGATVGILAATGGGGGDDPGFIDVTVVPPP